MNEIDFYISRDEFDKKSDEIDSWNDDFIDNISELLKTFTSSEINIRPISDKKSHDPKLNGTGCNVYIVLCSGNYFKIPELKDEFEDICKLCKEEGGNNSLFIINRSQDDFDKFENLPEQSKVYDFFVFDIATKELVEISEDNTPETRRNYWFKLVDIAFDIKSSTISESVKNSGSAKPKTIFLAECSHDQLGNRSFIRRELIHHGFRVVPDRPLPSDSLNHERRVNAYLRESSFSVHIIGEDNGRKISGTDLRVTEYQNNIAAKHSKDFFDEHNTLFPRLIWISPALRYIDENQQIYIHQLKKDTEALAGAEIIQTPMEVFKQIIREKITENKQDKVDFVEKSSDTKNIYIIHDEEFSKDIAPISEHLKDIGFKVLLPSFDQQKNIIKQHRRNLVNCDATIVYFANNNKSWLGSKVHDLIKAPGFGGTKPILASLVVNKSPEDISEFLTGYKQINISSIKEYNPKAIEPFLEKIK